jgi:hypothetical protein
MNSDDVFGGVAALFTGTFLIFILACAAFMIAAWWKVFTKAGQPGWAAIVPIYNMVILLKIVGRPLWWIILMFIPLVNIVIGIIVHLELAKSFGKGTGFGIGLLLLGPIFFPILGFGSARYLGPISGGTSAPPVLA